MEEAGEAAGRGLGGDLVESSSGDAPGASGGCAESIFGGDFEEVGRGKKDGDVGLVEDIGSDLEMRVFWERVDGGCGLGASIDSEGCGRGWDGVISGRGTEIGGSNLIKDTCDEE